MAIYYDTKTTYFSKCILRTTWIKITLSLLLSSVQFIHSVVSTFGNPIDCSTPDFPIHHQLQELAQTHVHWWCHPTISASLIPFSSCPQSFPALGSLPMSWFFESGGQSIGASASASVLPKNIQCWFPFGLTGLISLLSKGLLRVFSNTTVQKHRFFSTQLSLQSNSHSHTWPMEKPQPSLDGPSLVKWCQRKNEETETSKNHTQLWMWLVMEVK